MTTVPLGEARDRLSELVSLTRREHDRVEITVHGKPAAVLISPEDLASMEETIEILSDPELMVAIREGEADIAAGEAYSSDEIAEAMRNRRS